MAIMKSKGNYYLNVHRGGKFSRINLHTASRRTAEAHAKQIVTMLDREKSQRILANQLLSYAISLASGAIDRKHVRGALEALRRQAEAEAMEVIKQMLTDAPLTADDVWESYMEHVDRTAIKEVTLQGKHAKFLAFAKWMGKDADFRRVTTDTASQYLDQLKVTPQTRNNHISDLSTVWQGAELPNVWVASLRRKAEHAERSAVNLDDLRNLLRWCDSHGSETAKGISVETWGRFVRALYYSGLRPVDVALLTYAECVEGRIELTPTKTSRTRRKVSYVPDKRFFQSLDPRAVPLPTAYVFPAMADLYQHGRQFLVDGFRILCKHADVQGLTLYQLRHYWVTHQINAGIELDDVASAVGHVSASTTEGHYYHGKHSVKVADMPNL